MGRRGTKKRKAGCFSASETDLLEAYLAYYHRAVIKECFSHNQHDYDSDYDTDKDKYSDNNDSSDDDDKTIQRSNCLTTSFEKNSTWIAGIEFPALTKEVLQKPYLLLPSTLESKQRRLICDLCVHVGLFQSSVGDKFNGRQKVISVHPDGFDYLGMENDGREGDEGEGEENKLLSSSYHEKPLSFPVMHCRPWYFSNDIGDELEVGDDNNSDDSLKKIKKTPHELSRQLVYETTCQHRKTIQELVDYPQKCLRIDGVDNVEFFLKVDEANIMQNQVETVAEMIDSCDKMKQCAQELNTNKNITELAFDLEAYNASKYKQATCLIQLCTNEKKEYVIDVLAPGVWDSVSLLAPIFANPNIVKIGHGIPSIDIPCLHRDFGIFVVNGFDTMEGAKLLGLKKHLGLAKLYRYYKLQNDDRADKYDELKINFQNTDWRLRPLKKEMIEYGTLDVRFLIPLRQLLIRDMIKLVDDNDNDNDVASNNMLKQIGSFSSCVEDGDDDMQPLNESFDNNIPNPDESLNDFFMSAAMEDSNIENEDEEEGYYTADSSDNECDDFKNDNENVNDAKKEQQNSTERLKYNDILMETLRKGQNQCLSFWTDKNEILEKNGTLIQLMRRAEHLKEFNSGSKKKKKVWSMSDMALYKDLFQWRNDVAQKNGIIPAMMCPLDLLVLIAYTRPTNEIDLKRLNYFLPEFFQFDFNSDYLEEMFSIVFAAGNNYEPIFKNGVQFYSDRIIKSRSGQLKVSQDKDRSGDDNPSNILAAVGYKKSAIKWTAVIAGIAVFWIGVAKRKRV